MCVVGASASRIQLDKLITHDCGVGPEGCWPGVGSRMYGVVDSRLKFLMLEPTEADFVCGRARQDQWAVGCDEGRGQYIGRMKLEDKIMRDQLRSACSMNTLNKEIGSEDNTISVQRGIAAL